MRAIVVLFDSLNRNYLPNYGNKTVKAPNFMRLANTCVTFDTCYAGSLPCMPARRELHTGRYNFLHRGWGALEPFDDSMPELLSTAGIYTHLVTDHAHYWEDGGCTYHTRYTSWEGVRGQQGDHWKGHVDDPKIPEVVKVPRTPDGRKVAPVWRYDWVNREYLSAEEDFPQNRTFALGTEFIARNHAADNWLLQIETFDPHEPFIVPERFAALYPENYTGLHYDWPRGPCDEDEETIEHIRNLYRARVSLCDENLGKIPDAMDAYNLWDDTLLMVFSDHGFLLGEHAYWGKNGIPMYEEIAHTPLFIWDPRSRRRGERRSALVQTIDFAPTVLEFFQQPVPSDMQGRTLKATIEDDSQVREAALFGMYGEQVNITDGHYVYMRSSAGPDNTPLFMYTLMPTGMYSRFSAELLSGATLERPGWKFLRNSPVLKVKGVSRNPSGSGKHALYNLRESPGQEAESQDEEHMKEAMEMRLIRMLIEADAPPEQFQRLGLDPDLAKAEAPAGKKYTANHDPN
jgi:arylsulfatase A-like enzyme